MHIILLQIEQYVVQFLQKLSLHESHLIEHVLIHILLLQLSQKSFVLLILQISHLL